MKQYFFKSLSLFALFAVLCTSSFAQDEKNSKDEKNSNKIQEDEVIIITKKGDKDTKISVEIKDGEVKVNGKPLSEFNDDNVTIRKRSEMRHFDNLRTTSPVPPRSPFRRSGDLWATSENKAFLGVMTDEAENGAKVTAVTKGSAAEKAGLKEGDVITKVNETEIKHPQDLTEAVIALKPESKATIAFKRDKKEQKVTATLGKRAATAMVAPGDFGMNDFNFSMDNDGSFGVFPGRGRFGIKAQDTEEGKGVKVLDVDEESNAAKAGIKEGDIIHEFDGDEVNSATELAQAARDAREKNNVKVKLSREGKTQELEIKIPKKLKTTNL